MFDSFDLDVALTLLIIALVAWAALRQGKANPVGTGRLQSDVTQLKADVAAIRKDLDAAPSSADLEVVRTDIAGLRREVELVTKAADRTEQAVVRIEQLLLQRALPPTRSGRSKS